MWLAMWWCYFVYKILLKFRMKLQNHTCITQKKKKKKNRNEILLWKWELYVDFISRGIAVQDWELKIVRATVLSSLLDF